MVLYPAATSADSPLAHMVVHPVQLALVVLFHPPTGANTALALGQLALCGGGLWWYIYIYTHTDSGGVLHVSVGLAQARPNNFTYTCIKRYVLLLTAIVGCCNHNT